jgi:3-(3-hydroxy-phenyl)propionate hydroxylase
VAVVGLGPVGSTAALLLAAQGVPIVALERDLEVSPLPRAVALDDEALRVLQAVGLDAHSRPALLTTPTVRFRSRRAKPLLELPPIPRPTGIPRSRSSDSPTSIPSCGGTCTART